MIAFGTQLGLLNEADQLVTHIVRMPEYRRVLIDADAALTRHVDALGESDPAILKAREAYERAAIKYNQIAGAIAAAWRAAQAAGRVGEPQMSGLEGTTAQTAIRMTAAVAIIIIAFLTLPVSVLLAAFVALVAALAALAEYVDASAAKARITGYPIFDSSGKVLAPSPTQQTTEMIGAVSGGLGKVALLALLAFGAYFALGRRR